MAKIELEEKLSDLVKSLKFNSNKTYKLIICTGLLGDFDSFEYAINLSKIISNKKFADLEVLLIAIGNKNGKEKFSKYTGLPESKIRVVSDNKIHEILGASKGLDTGLGGWINMILMLMGIGSSKTIPEVIRGYIGDKGSNQIYRDEDNINLLNIFKFSGKLFKNSFGNGYLRPFELATFRLNNMIEIFKNWEDYMINTKYLPQRSCTFILDKNNNIKYKYFSKDILNYSHDMSSPLEFLSKYIK